EHPEWSKKGIYYTLTQPPPGAQRLAIHIRLLHPKHFYGVAQFTPAQEEMLALYYKEYKEKWIEAILLQKPSAYSFQESTQQVVIRRLSRLLDIQVVNGMLDCKGIYSNMHGEQTLSDIVTQIESSKTLIIDTSSLTGQSEIFLSSLITNTVFDAYRYYRQKGVLNQKPHVLVALEEAPRVIGKDVLERGPNVFSTIAKEGRKFRVGLCAITQLPSLIPKEILANINTKIILGLEMATERNAIIESAAQDLSDDSRQIAALDKGEAIISSNFTRFAIPVKIPLFSDVIKLTKKDMPKRNLQGIS
ncbi:MAG: ATP-binding protein, partial [Candidatus Woesearchaeota archaeon]